MKSCMSQSLLPNSDHWSYLQNNRMIRKLGDQSKFSFLFIDEETETQTKREVICSKSHSKTVENIQLKGESLKS